MKQSRKRWLRQKLLPLGWKIIEYKLMYYYPDMVHRDWHQQLTIHDDIYDDLERRYLRYSFALKTYNYNVHKTHFEWQDNEHAMFEVDFTRPSVQLVLSKIGSPMSNVEQMKEQDFSRTKYPKFRLLTGGKGPPDGPTENWLAEYAEGTTFVCRSINSKQVDLNLYTVIYKSLPDVVLLKWELPDGKMLDYYVDPERFSRQMEKPTILGIVKIRATEVAGEDNDSDRTDRPRDVVLDAPVP